MTQELKTTMEGLSRQYRVTGHRGWGMILFGKSRGGHVEDALTQMNRDGYKPVFHMQDEWTWLRALFFTLVWLVTLGFYTQKEDVIIIAERVDS